MSNLKWEKKPILDLGTAFVAYSIVIKVSFYFKIASHNIHTLQMSYKWFDFNLGESGWKILRHQRTE